jgi:hypothetical protein
MVFVPQYETLKVKHIYQFLNRYPDCYQYYPDAREIEKVPKQWLVNVAAAVVGQPFEDWVDQMVIERNEKVAVEKDVMIDVDPAIAQCIRESNDVSRKYNHSFVL